MSARRLAIPSVLGSRHAVERKRERPLIKVSCHIGRRAVPGTLELTLHNCTSLDLKSKSRGRINRLKGAIQNVLTLSGLAYFGVSGI